MTYYGRGKIVVLDNFAEIGRVFGLLCSHPPHLRRVVAWFWTYVGTSNEYTRRKKKKKKRGREDTCRRSGVVGVESIAKPPRDDISQSLQQQQQRCRPSLPVGHCFGVCAAREMLQSTARGEGGGVGRAAPAESRLYWSAALAHGPYLSAVISREKRGRAYPHSS